MTYIDKLFNDQDFCIAINNAINYCRQHHIKYKWIERDYYISFAWLDPDDNEIHIKLDEVE